MNAILRSLAAALILAALWAAEMAVAQPAVKQLVDAEPDAKPAQAPAETPPPPAGPADDFDRGVPRSSVTAFLSAAEQDDWERAGEYLDVRSLPRGLEPREAPALARQLSTVLDRALWIHPENLSDDPKGQTDDGLPSYRDFVGRIEAPDEQVDVLLQRVPRGDGVFIWKFSNATVARVPALYAEFGFGQLGERLVDLLPPGRILGIPFWEWAGIALLLPAAALVAWLARWLLVAILRLTRLPGIESIEQTFRGPVWFLLFCLVGRSALVLLGPTVALRALMQAQTLFLVAVSWLAMRVADVLIERAAERLRERGQAAAHMLGRPARNFARGLVVLVALVLWLDNLGIRVTTLIAGLGIGGLAVALAAQRSIEDLIGAFTLYATQPVRVGDFCRFGPNSGTVEEIGLRSTRVRTLDDSIVSVPNGEFSKLHVENLGERRKILYSPRIRLRYETTPDQLRCILVEIRSILYAHPKLLADPARIRFVGFGESSLDLDVFAYVNTQDYGEYLGITEDLNLRIMDTVLDAGSRFAVPAQTTYLESGPGLDVERAGAAETRVREWRERRELYLPGFPPAVVDSLRGTLPYPSEGSPEATDTLARVSEPPDR